MNALNIAVVFALASIVASERLNSPCKVQSKGAVLESGVCPAGEECNQVIKLTKDDVIMYEITFCSAETVGCGDSLPFVCDEDSECPRFTACQSGYKFVSDDEPNPDPVKMCATRSGYLLASDVDFTNCL